MPKWLARFQRRVPVAYPALSAPTIEDVPFDVADCDLKSAGFVTRATDLDGNPIWPDDPDEIPSWWFERQAWATINGTSLPPYRTRREMEAAINAIEMAERGFEPMAMSGPFSPDEAASRFLAYLQSHNVRQEYSAAELTEVYTEYCSTQNIVASAIDFVKAALALMPAVSKKKVDRKGADGKRQRVVCWVIEPRLAPTTTAKSEPAKPVEINDIEPIRMAA